MPRRSRSAGDARGSRRGPRGRARPLPGQGVCFQRAASQRAGLVSDGVAPVELDLELGGRNDICELGGDVARLGPELPLLSKSGSSRNRGIVVPRAWPRGTRSFPELGLPLSFYERLRRPFFRRPGGRSFPAEAHTLGLHDLRRGTRRRDRTVDPLDGTADRQRRLGRARGAGRRGARRGRGRGGRFGRGSDGRRAARRDVGQRAAKHGRRRREHSGRARGRGPRPPGPFFPVFDRALRGAHCRRAPGRLCGYDRRRQPRRVPTREGRDFGDPRRQK
jgi:hypothetical protein